MSVDLSDLLVFTYQNTYYLYDKDDQIVYEDGNSTRFPAGQLEGWQVDFDDGNYIKVPNFSPLKIMLPLRPTAEQIYEGLRANDPV